MFSLQTTRIASQRASCARAFIGSCYTSFLRTTMNTESAAVVKTSHGPIRGESCTSIYGDQYFRFQSIPYASPPIGELRFKAPVPPQPWTEMLNCTKPMPKAMQLDYSNKIEGTEDCLYLTISTKKLHSEKPLPILVFIHGGGFERGDPNRGADYFMMRDVILITVAYRLGPFGFLSFKDPTLEIPGNAGLKDQIQALRWIKANAKNFNGDPENITLFGESAGGASVHHLMLTPQTEGLFHKAILMSGVVLCPFGLTQIENATYRLAEKIGYKGDLTDKAVCGFFRQAPPESLLSSKLLTREDYMNDTHFAFVPSIEPYESDSCVLSVPPSELMARTWSNRIPIMIGGTSHEGLLVYGAAKAAPFLITDLDSKPEYLLPLDVRDKLKLPQQHELIKLVRETHFGSKALGLDSLLAYCELVTYKVFWLPIVRSIAGRMSCGRAAATYLYRFAFDSPTFNHHRLRFCGNECRGAAHADELSYLFYGDYAEKLAPETAEFKTIVRMIDLWTSFAINSVPNCAQASLSWAPLQDAKTLTCLHISNELKVEPLPEASKLAAWLKLYSNHSLSPEHMSSKM